MTDQLTGGDLAHMTPQQINEARLGGRLNILMGGEAPIDPGARITRADLTRLHAQRRYEEIDALRRDGRLADILAGTDTTPAVAETLPLPPTPEAPAQDRRPSSGIRW